MSRPYAEVIGDPISHSKSPKIHGLWLERLGLDAEYRACHVRANELESYFTTRRADPQWRGCNVTIPHKEAVGAYLDEVDARAKKVGAVNTVWKVDGRLHGTNTDVEGVAEALQGLDLAGRDVAVIGAGGAARSAFAQLEAPGCGSVRVIARNAPKATATLADFDLPSRVCSFEDAPAAIVGAALVINATQLGMSGQPPMPRGVLDALGTMDGGGFVFDMVYAPRETDLLKAAAAQGLHCVGGLVMLVGQARTAFSRFFENLPPRDFDNDLFGMLEQ